jgi:tetratricopeptide (TPR) repeat protein
MEFEKLCKVCGHPHNFVAESGGPVLFLRSDALIPLYEFMTGKLDHPRCKVCDTPATFTQTVSLIFEPTGSVLIAAGDSMKSAAPEKMTSLLEMLKQSANEISPSKKWQFKQFDSLPSLRKAAITENVRHIPIVNEIQKIKDTYAMYRYVEQHWREIDSNVIVASFLILGSRGGGPGIVLLLADLQAWVWMFLCTYWCDPKASGSFEGDLKKFIVAVAIIPKMVEQFNTICEVTLKKVSGQLAFEYCVEAVRASIHRIVHQTNPKGTRWATLFVKLEMQARRAALTTPNPDLNRLRVSTTRASWSATYPQLCDGFGLSIKIGEIDDLDIAQQLAFELGYPDLLGHVLGSFVISSKSEQDLPKVVQLLDEMLEIAPEEYKTEDTVAGSLEAIVSAYPREISVDELIELRDVARKHFPSTKLCRAKIDVWLAEKFNARRHPRRALELLKLGSFGPGNRLPEGVATALFTEVGTAFRLIGLPNRALLAYDKVVDILEAGRRKRGEESEPADLRTAKRNLAIAHRECGAPDVGLSILEKLWETAFGHDDVPVLESLAATYLAVGNNAQALQCLNSALKRAVGPLQYHALRLRSFRAMVLSLDADKSNLPDELLKLPLPDEHDLSALVLQACAWINILAASDTAHFIKSPPVEERVTHLGALLLELDEISRDRTDVQASVILLTLLSYLYEILEDPEADNTWSELQRISHIAGQGDNVYALFAFARLSYECGDIDEGRRWLQLIPKSFIASIGLVERLHIAARALSWHSHAFKRVARAIGSQSAATLEDYRLIAEISRDTVRWAIKKQPKGASVETDALNPFVAPLDENLKRLAPDSGVLGIVEWVHFGPSIGAIITTINDSGDVQSRWLKMPSFNLFDITNRTRSRLSGWTSLTPGDPFENAAWREFEDWLLEEVGQVLPDDEHLIIIESSDFLGLPWHIAASSHWSCSYASGWQVLFELVRQSDSIGGDEVRIGVACVGTYDDGKDLLATLRQSSRRTEDFASSNGYRCESAYDTGCDHARFSELISEANVFKILCHGYVSRREDEVAFMIATQQSLPLKLPQAAETEIGRAHRFSWKDFGKLQRSLQVVFSAACSSLSTHIVGQGERLGIFASLRERGTRAFVAPAWDIEPQFALPVLDSVMESYIKEGKHLGRILRAECTRASSSVPRWLAWSLSIEGDWR